MGRVRWVYDTTPVLLWQLPASRGRAVDASAVHAMHLKQEPCIPDTKPFWYRSIFIPRHSTYVPFSRVLDLMALAVSLMCYLILFSCFSSSAACTPPQSSPPSPTTPARSWTSWCAC